ncbi:MAG: hypothetical protein Kow0025_26340 [Thermodesulfovibrionales bacterium]
MENTGSRASSETAEAEKEKRGEILRLLEEMDRALLVEFNSRSIERLKERKPALRAALPFFEAFREANVRKEVDKDRLIIEQAAAAREAGRELDVEEVFAMTRAVDARFLDRLPAVPVRVDYGAIEPIRAERIRLIARGVRVLLDHGREARGLEEAVRMAYTREGYRDLILGILRLYNEETRALSRSIKLPPLVGMAAGAFSRALYGVMEEVSGELAEEYASRAFGRREGVARP